MTAKTAGQAACEAYDVALFGTAGADQDVWETRGDRERAAWEAAARAGTATAWRLLDEARAENERLRREWRAASEQEDGTARAYDNVSRDRDGLRKRLAAVTAERDRYRTALTAIDEAALETADGGGTVPSALAVRLETVTGERDSAREALQAVHAQVGTLRGEVSSLTIRAAEAETERDAAREVAAEMLAEFGSPLDRGWHVANARAADIADWRKRAGLET